MLKKVSAALASACLLAATAVHADDWRPVEDRMTAEQFHAAGLHKLDTTELQQLNQFLRGREQVVARDVQQRKRREPAPPRHQVEAHIDGAFEGWTENTVFILDNGEHWKIAESSRFRTSLMQNPAVTIKPMSFGSWLMDVRGCACSVRVKRVD